MAARRGSALEAAGERAERAAFDEGRTLDNAVDAKPTSPENPEPPGSTFT